MVCGVSLKRFANSVISRITFGTEYLPYAWSIRPYSIIASESWSSWLNSSAVNRRSFRRARLTWTITCPKCSRYITLAPNRAKERANHLRLIQGQGKDVAWF